MSKIRNVNDIIFIDSPNPGLEAQLDNSFERISGLLQWRVKDKSILEKALDFVKTTTSGLVSDEVYNQRLAACLSCPALVIDKKGKKYCGGCNCGRWLFAELDGSIAPKLKWTSLKCPLRRF